MPNQTGVEDNVTTFRNLLLLSAGLVMNPNNGNMVIIFLTRYSEEPTDAE